MTRSALVAEDAQRDIREARRWYYSRDGAALDARFVLALDVTLTRITQFPEIAPSVHAAIRRALLKPFPYVLLYEARESVLVVHRCIHAHRDPIRWRSVAR